MVAVAIWAEVTPAPPSRRPPPRRWTKSAASEGNRSSRPSVQRCSIATFRPSTKPRSFRPRRNAARDASNWRQMTRHREIQSPELPAAGRHRQRPPAAPPSPVMNSRRPVAVGTCVSSHAPRPEPYVRLSRIRLLPRVCDGTSCRIRSSACDTRAWFSPVRALLVRIPLGPRPSLHRLRCDRPCRRLRRELSSLCSSASQLL